MVRSAGVEPARRTRLVVPPLAHLGRSAMADRHATPEDDALRNEITRMLAAGIDAEVWPRAETSEMVNDIVGQLRHDATGDTKAKLVIAGYTDHMIEAGGMEQSCETCMYYLVHRKFCELPELMLP